MIKYQKYLVLSMDMNTRGSALISMLAAAAIGMIIMAAMTSFFNQTANFNKDMRSKIELSGLHQGLIRSFADPEICKEMLAGKRVPVKGEDFSFEDPIFGVIKSGLKVGELTIKSVTVGEVHPLPSGLIAATILLRVDSEKGPAMKDRKIPVYVVPESSRIVSCSSMAGPLGSCPAGEVLTGRNPDGTPQCRSIATVIQENPKTKTYYLRFYNGLSFKGQFIGEVYLNEDQIRLVSVSTPAGRNTKFAVTVKGGVISVEPAPGFYPQVCFYHKGHGPIGNGTPQCFVTGKDKNGGNIYNCGLPIGWIGSASGNTSTMGAVNCGNWGGG